MARPSVDKLTRKTSTAMPGMERHRQNFKISMPNLAFVRCFVTMLLRFGSKLPRRKAVPRSDAPVTNEHNALEFGRMQADSGCALKVPLPWGLRPRGPLCCYPGTLT